MNEGFFADVVVLVEGEQDRAALLATATSLNYDLESLGVAVIPCSGKANLDRPALIFRALGIPTYVLWDSDQGQPHATPRPNKLLLKVIGLPEESYSDFVGTAAAAFRVKLEATLSNELTPATMDPLVLALQSEFEMRRDDVLKNPDVMAELLRRAMSLGARSTTLEQIVTAVLALRPTLTASSTA